MPDRYEREIDDLLHHLNRRRRESVGERMARKLRPYSDGFQRALAAFLRRPPTEQFMIAAMFLVVISFAMLNFLGMEKWAGYVSVLSLVLFLIGIALSVAGRRSPGYRQRWRGREVQYDNYGPSIWSSLRRWFRRRGR